MEIRLNTFRKLAVACSLLSGTAVYLLAANVESLRAAQQDDQGSFTLIVGKKQLRGRLGERSSRGIFISTNSDTELDKIFVLDRDSGLRFSVDADSIASVDVSPKPLPDNAGTCAGEKEMRLILSDGRALTGCRTPDAWPILYSKGVSIGLTDQAGEVKVLWSASVPSVQGPKGAQATSETEPAEVNTNGEATSAKATIEKIRQGKYVPMPSAQAAPAAAGGGTSMVLTNDTKYELTVYLSGPASRVIKVAANSTETAVLAAGHYEVAAKVSNPAILPFYGVENYAADTHYSEKFYIGSRPR